MENKKVIIIGTGGTIAGQSAAADDLTGYKSGSLTVDDLLKAVPNLGDYSPLESIQFANLESSDILPEQWVSLAKLVQEFLDRDDVAGVVVTHGTDSMEETAYFLHLTIDSKKPVVLTGAMRPATAISADGPLNILQAVQTVRTPESAEKGVLLLLNGFLDGAREVRKMNTTNVATFGNAIFGHLGLVQEGVAHFYQMSTRKHTFMSRFAKLPSLLEGALPRVVMLHLYTGIEADMVERILELPIDGLVLAGLGHGTIPKQIRQILAHTSIPIVRASRTTSGMVSAVPSDGDTYLVADTLTAEKARILLMLGLTVTKNKKELQSFFHEY